MIKKRLTLLLLVSTLLTAGIAHAQITCIDLLVNPNAVQQLARGFENFGRQLTQNLPEAFSPEWEQLRDATREQLETGWATLNTQDYIGTQVGSEIYNQLPSDLYLWDLLKPSATRDIGNESSISSPLRDYMDWITALLRQALPNERFSIYQAQLRYITPDDGIVVESRHIDGGHLTVLTTLLGPSTLYVPDRQPLAPTLQRQRDRLRTLMESPMIQPSLGETLILSNSERQTLRGIPGTLHMSPSLGERRLVLLLRYTTDR